MNKKYKIHNTNLFRYSTITFDNLKNAKICYIDSEIENAKNIDNDYSTISFKLKDIQLNNNNINSINIIDIYKLYDVIINNYYNISFCNKNTEEYKNNTLRYNILKEEDKSLYIKNIYNKMYMLSNIIQRNLMGEQANICILPQKIYDILPNTFNSFKMVLNPTNLHNDKIFIIRLTDNFTDQGSTIFMNENFNEIDRKIKILKILKRKNKILKDYKLNYNLVNIGEKCKYTVGVLYLND